jgi:hypothetical protein
MKRRKRNAEHRDGIPREAMVFGPTVGATGLGGKTGYASPGDFEMYGREDD